MVSVLQQSTLRRRTLRRHMRTRTIVVVSLAVIVLSGAAVVALGSGAGSGDVPSQVRAEAAHQGLDPAILAVVVEREKVSLDHTGSQTELRSAARRLRRAIDRHQSLVGALAASQAGDEQVSQWIASDPRVATQPAAIPSAEVRDFVSGILVASGSSATTGTGR